MGALGIKQGQNLCLFIDASGTDKCIAAATNCTLETSMEIKDISSKDSTGNWAEGTTGKHSWTVSSDNLYTEDIDDETAVNSGFSYSHLFALKSAGTLLTITWGGLTTDDMGRQQTLGTGTNMTGTAYITSLSLSSPNDDNATYSVSLQGIGALTQI